MASNSNDKEKENLPPIIKKVHKGGHGGHHGGSWKIAYADFVTAMMAFFLLMWLLASLNKAQKDGLADYFKQPLKIALISGDSMGARQISVKGGGNNLEKKDGQVSASNQPIKADKQNALMEGDNKKQEMKQLQELKANITDSINKDPSLTDLKDRLLMDVTSEGLRIQLVDNKDKAMFGLGSDEIDPEMQQVLSKIALMLNGVPNKVTIQGHTDAHPYHNPDDLNQTNWELSTQRANTARRAMIKAGMQEDKVMRVTGYASTVLLDKKDPLNPINRRISIIVMKKTMTDKILEDD